MNSRRRISAPTQGQHCIGSNEYFVGAQAGIKTVAAMHTRVLMRPLMS